MSWVEIKKALNSSLGKNTFEPLDELVTSGKSLVTSNNVYYTLWSGSKVPTEDTEWFIPLSITNRTLNTFKIKISGTNASSYSNSQAATIKIYKNGTVSSTLNLTGTDAVNYTTSTITAQKDDILKISITATDVRTGMTYTSVQMLADMRDTSPVKFTSI